MPISRPSFAFALVWFGIAGIGGCAGVWDNADVIRVSSPVTAFGNAPQITRSGVACFQRGEFDAAEASFKRAIRIDDSYGPAHNNLGRVYYQRGELKRAADAFSWAIQFMPGRPEPINNLGLILESTGKFDDAIDLYQSAHLANPEASEYLANLVRVRMRSGERGAEVLTELQRLKFIESRPEWVAWVDENLALAGAQEMNPKVRPPATTFSSAPDTIPSSALTFGPTIEQPIETSAEPNGPELALPTNVRPSEAFEILPN